MLLRSGRDLGYKVEKRLSPLEDERLSTTSTQLRLRHAVDDRASISVYHTFVAAVPRMVGLGSSVLESVFDAVELFTTAVSADLKFNRDRRAADREDFEAIEKVYQDDFPFFSWDVGMTPKKLVAFVHFDQTIQVLMCKWSQRCASLRKAAQYCQGEEMSLEA